MRYEWDPVKDALNRRKHGLSLADGIPALDDPERRFWLDDRFDYGEVRAVTVGRNADRVLVVVSVERIRTGSGEDKLKEEIVRIISVRKAVKRETEWFYSGGA
jgi:uncharacterized DUF497 family protein